MRLTLLKIAVVAAAGDSFITSKFAFAFSSDPPTSLHGRRNKVKYDVVPKASRKVLSRTTITTILFLEKKKTTTTTTENDKDTTSKTKRKTKPKMILPPNILGPPEPLKSLQIGPHHHLNAFRSIPPSFYSDSDSNRDDNANNEGSSSSSKTLRHDFTIERAANTPDIFLLRNFLTSYECKQIQNMAATHSERRQAGTVSQIIDGKARKNCLVAWLPSMMSGDSSTSSSSSTTSSSSSNDDDVDENKENNNNNNHNNHTKNNDNEKIIPNLVSATSNILLSPSILSHPTAGVEDLQVLEYGTGGEFILHHDGEPRILTVLYYLNGVGGTWFPLADINLCNSNNNEAGLIEDGDAIPISSSSIGKPKNKAEALQIIEDGNFIPGEHGLLVQGKGKDGQMQQHQQKEQQQSSSGDNKHNNKHVVNINAGDAIAFYNYLDDGSGKFDWRSIHCGLPTSKEDGVKWIANHWFRLNYLEDV